MLTAKATVRPDTNKAKVDSFSIKTVNILQIIHFSFYISAFPNESVLLSLSALIKFNPFQNVSNIFVVAEFNNGTVAYPPSDFMKTNAPADYNKRVVRHLVQTYESGASSLSNDSKVKSGRRKKNCKTIFFIASHIVLTRLTTSSTA